MIELFFPRLTLEETRNVNYLMVYLNRVCVFIGHLRRRRQGRAGQGRERARADLFGRVKGS